MARSDFGILAIAAKQAFSPSALFPAALSSLARSLIAARSSAVKLFDDAVVRFVVFFVVFFWVAFLLVVERGMVTTSKVV
jgi:hypothetical protein